MAEKPILTTRLTSLFLWLAFLMLFYGRSLFLSPHQTFIFSFKIALAQVWRKKRRRKKEEEAFWKFRLLHYIPGRKIL